MLNFDGSIEVILNRPIIQELQLAFISSVPPGTKQKFTPLIFVFFSSLSWLIPAPSYSLFFTTLWPNLFLPYWLSFGTAEISLSLNLLTGYFCFILLERLKPLDMAEVLCIRKHVIDRRQKASWLKDAFYNSLTLETHEVLSNAISFGHHGEH